MAEIINLRTARKGKARAEARQLANENSVRFGRSKALKQLEEMRAEQVRSELEAHRREGPKK